MTDTMWQLVIAIAVPCVTALLGWWFGRRRDTVNIELLIAEGLAKAAEKEKLFAEAANLNAATENSYASYWQKMAEDVEAKAKLREAENMRKISELETRFAKFDELNKSVMVENRELKVRVSRLQAAFEYLCVQFERDYSLIVEQARAIAPTEKVV